MNVFVIIITNTFKKDKNMPKIIDNVREQIQKEVFNQMLTKGYSKTTIRSVAKAVGIGTGTMYNYFSSKDELIASFMLDDWRLCVETMEKVPFESSEAFLRQIHGALKTFISKYEKVFKDKDAIRAFSTVFPERHLQFRAKIGGFVAPACEETDYEDKKFLSEHIAECIINWTMADIPFDKQYSIIKRLL